MEGSRHRWSWQRHFPRSLFAGAGSAIGSNTTTPHHTHRSHYGTNSQYANVLCMVLARNARAVVDMPRRLPQNWVLRNLPCLSRIVRYRRHGNARRRRLREPTFCRLTNKGGTNGSPASAHNQLTAHRAAAKESCALMRATIADIQEIIQHCRKIIDDGREAMRRVDDRLLTKKPQLEL